MEERANFKRKTLIEGHSGAIYSIQFDGTYIYSASGDRYVTRWNSTTGEQDKFAIKLPATPYTIQLFDHYSKLCVGLSNGDFHIFDIESRTEVKHVKLHKNGIFAMAENPLKQQLYISDADGLISVWNTKTLELSIQLPFNCEKIRRIVPSSDGSKMYFSAKDGQIRVIDTTYFNELHSFFGHNDGVGALLETKDTLISGGKDAYIHIWDKTSFNLLKRIPAHNYMVYELLQLNDNIIISASRDKTIKIWDAKEMKVLQRFELKNGGHKHSVNALIKLDDHCFASCSDDAKVIIFSNN